MLASLMQRVFNKSKEFEQVGAISGEQGDYVDTAQSFTETAHKYVRYNKGEQTSVLNRIKLPTFVQERSSMSNDIRSGGNKDIN